MTLLDHTVCYRALTTRDVRFDGRLFVAVITTGIRGEAWRPWRAYAAQHLWTADADARSSDG